MHESLNKGHYTTGHAVQELFLLNQADSIYLSNLIKEFEDYFSRQVTDKQNV